MAGLREMLRDLEGHVAALERAGRQLADLLPVIAAAMGAVHDDVRAIARLQGFAVAKRVGADVPGLHIR
jgi:hypothetical protein